MTDNKFIDNRIVLRIPPVRVEIKTCFGLLAKAAKLADQIWYFRVWPVGLLDGSALADAPADVLTGEIHCPEWSHCHSKRFQCRVDLLRKCTLFEKKIGLPKILLKHPVADETIANPGYDANLADRLGKIHDGN